MGMDIKIEIQGTTPLLQHNVRLSNPMDPHAKALSEAVSAYKKDKTDVSFNNQAHIEWTGGLYHNERIGVYVPSSWIMGSFARGGVIYGKKGTAVKQALIISDMEIQLLHNGPKTLDELWADDRFHDIRAAGVGRNKVQRCRPAFPVWGLVTEAYLDDSVLDLKVLQVIAEKAGSLAGIGDYRPEKSGTFGRYTAKISKL